MKKQIYFFALFSLVIGLWIAYPFIITQQFVIDLFPKGNWASRGVVGDSFGALNTLFSGLALAGLAVNIYLQSVQLKKLEVKEEDNSSRLDLHAEIASITALIQYYNSEVDRITNLFMQNKSSLPDNGESLVEKVRLLNIIREDLVARLTKKSNLQR